MVTFCPADTYTAVTCPETPNCRFACWAGWIVPEAATVWRMVPVDTVTRWVVTDRGALEEPPEVATRVTTTPTAAASTTARPTSTWLRVGRRLRRVGGASWTAGSSGI